MKAKDMHEPHESETSEEESYVLHEIESTTPSLHLFPLLPGSAIWKVILEPLPRHASNIPQRVDTRCCDTSDVDTSACSSYAGGMEIHFSPEQEARLMQIAVHAGTDTECVVKEAALRMVDETERFRAAVREGVAQADRGELIEDEEVLHWLQLRQRS